MIRALATALVLLCKPVEPKSFIAKGLTKRPLSLDVKPKGVSLHEGNAVLWSSDQSGFAVMFAADDSWVALKGPYPSGSVLIAGTTRGAKLTAVDPLASLTADERTRVPETSCGASWFKGWKNTPKALELVVDQGAQPPLTLYVSPSGTVSR